VDNPFSASGSAREIAEESLHLAGSFSTGRPADDAVQAQQRARHLPSVAGEGVRKLRDPVKVGRFLEGFQLFEG
jgi:hypothetical protein